MSNLTDHQSQIIKDVLSDILTKMKIAPNEIGRLIDAFLKQIDRCDSTFFQQHLAPLFFETPKTVERKIIVHFLTYALAEQLREGQLKDIQKFFSDIYSRHPFTDPGKSTELRERSINIWKDGEKLGSLDFNSPIKWSDLFKELPLSDLAGKLAAFIELCNEKEIKTLTIDLSDVARIDQIPIFELLENLTTVTDVKFEKNAPEKSLIKARFEKTAARNTGIAQAHVRVNPNSMNPWDDYFTARLNNTGLVNAEDGANGVFNLFEPYNMDEHKITDAFNTIAVDSFRAFLNFLAQHEDDYGSHFPYTGIIVGDTNDYEYGGVERAEPGNTTAYLNLLAAYLEATPKKYFPFASLELMVPQLSEDKAEHRENEAHLLRIFKALGQHPEVTQLRIIKNHVIKNTFPTQANYQLSGELAARLLNALQNATAAQPVFTGILQVADSEKTIPLKNLLSNKRRQKESAQLKIAREKLASEIQPKPAPKKSGWGAAAKKSAAPAAEIQRPVTLVLETEVATEVAVSQESAEKHIDRNQLLDRKKMTDEFCKAHSPYRKVFIESAIMQNLPNFPDDIAEGMGDKVGQDIKNYEAWADNLWNQLLGDEKLTHTIKLISPEAFLKLCSAPQFLTGGITVSELPPGFYIEEDALLYDSQLESKHKKQNPLVRDWAPKATFKPWVGDAHQFVKDSTDDFNKLFQQFNQDTKGVDPQELFKFFKTCVAGLYPPQKLPKEISEFLTKYFKKDYNAELTEPYARKFANISQLFLLANLTYRFGIEGLSYFIENLEVLKKHSSLCTSFFKYGFGGDLKYLNEQRFINGGVFSMNCQAALSGAVAAWSTPEALLTMRKLTQLTPNEIIWWNKLIQAEFNSAGYVDIVSVYKGFRYFLDEIQKIGLVLPEDCPIQGSGPLTQLNTILSLLNAVTESKRQDQFESLVVKNNALEILNNHANAIYQSLDFEHFDPQGIKEFLKGAKKTLGIFISDPILSLWITSGAEIFNPKPTNQMICDCFNQVRQTLKDNKHNLPLTTDGALYAVQHDGFAITHQAMMLTAENLFGKDSYRVTFEELQGIVDVQLAQRSAASGSAAAAEDGAEKPDLSMLCHRFIASSGRELNNTYQLYVEFIDHLIKQTEKKPFIKSFIPTLMLAITGRRGAKAFDMKKFDRFLSKINDHNQATLINIFNQLNQHSVFLNQLQNKLSSPNLDELLGLISIILESNPDENEINGVIQRLIGDGAISDQEMQAWALWDRNRSHLSAKDFINLAQTIKISENDHVRHYPGEWTGIIALLQVEKDISITTEQLNQFLDKIPERLRTSPIYQPLLSLLSMIDILSLEAKKIDLQSLEKIFTNEDLLKADITIDYLIKIIQEAFPKCKFIESTGIMRPPLSVKIEREYWGDLSYVNEVLKEIGKINPKLDSFENIEARDHDQPTIIQLYRFALRIKQKKENIIAQYKNLDQTAKENLEADQLMTALKYEGGGIAGLASLVVKQPTSIQGMFEQLLTNMFKNKLELIINAFPKNPQIPDKALPAFEALKKRFPQPKFPEIEIAKDTTEKKSQQQEIALAQYQSDCQSIEKLYSTTLALHRKWPTQFKLDAILDKTKRLQPPITAYQLGVIFSAIQNIDAPYLPSELFELFSNSNFSKLSQTVTDVLVFQHVSLLDKIKMLQGVLKKPKNASAVYQLPALLDQYQHSAILCEYISEIYFKLIDRADISHILNGVALLLENASCDDVREKILANFSHALANIADLCALIDITKLIAGSDDKKAYLNIIAYGILDGDYTTLPETIDSTPSSPAASPRATALAVAAGSEEDNLEAQSPFAAAAAAAGDGSQAESRPPTPRLNIFTGENSYAKQLSGNISTLAPYYDPQRAVVRPGLEQLKAALERNAGKQDGVSVQEWSTSAASNPDNKRAEHISQSQKYIHDSLVNRLQQFTVINHAESGNDYLSSFYLQKLYNSILYVDALRFGEIDATLSDIVRLKLPIIKDGKKESKEIKLSELSNEELKTLASYYKKAFTEDLSKKSPDEVWLKRCKFLSIACEALYRTTKKWPNEMQIMSVLTHMMHGGNVISEIPTGAGKSIINNLLAMMQWVDGKTVDVCTSNMGLARRDHHNHQRFYQLLGVFSGVITADSKSDDYQKHQIHFSDVSQLSLYRQKTRTEMLEEDASKNRALILDEADPQLLAYTPSKQVSRKFVAQGRVAENPHAKLFDEILEYAASHDEFKLLAQFKKEHVALFCQALTSSSASYAAKQSARVTSDDDLLEWMNAALTIQGLREGRDYIIQSKLEALDGGKTIGRSRAIIIDSEGAPQEKPRFGKHVHQFLHAHLNRRMQNDPDFYKSCNGYEFVYEPSGLRTSSETVLQFIRGYRVFWGNTGTLGGRNEAHRLHSVYHATALKCPSYYEDKLQRQDPVCVAADQHYPEILKQLGENNAIQPQRPILLFCKDMTQARALEHYLLSQEGLLKEKLQLHDAQAELIGQKASRVLDKAGCDGMITITTSILGRGADFHTEHKKGFHAIITSAELDSRSVRQMAGRAGRKGHAGTWQFVVKKSDLNIKEDVALSSDFIERAITQKQDELANKSDARLETEEQYADILHHYWEDFLNISRELKNQVPASANNALWKQCHNANQQRLGAFFQTIERKYDESHDQADALQSLIHFANNEWKKAVADMQSSVSQIVAQHQAKKSAISGAVPAASAQREPLLSTPYAELRPLTAPAQAPFTYTTREQAAVTSLSITDAVSQLPHFSDTKTLHDADNDIVKKLRAIDNRLKQLGMHTNINIEGKTAEGLVNEYTKFLLSKYIEIVNKKDVYAAPIQHVLIEIRAQFVMLLDAVKEYPDDLKSKKEIMGSLDQAVKDTRQANEDASPQVKLSIARFENQVKRFVLLPALQLGAAAPAAAAQAPQHEHWNKVKQYAEDALKKYLSDSWFVASDRKELVYKLLSDQSGLHSINSCGPKDPEYGKSAALEPEALQKLLQRILDNQKQIAQKDAEVDKTRFFRGPRNIMSSRLMDTLNDIAALIVQEQLKMQAEQAAEPQASSAAAEPPMRSAAGKPQAKSKPIAENLKPIIQVIVNRQTELQAKNQLPLGYQEIKTITEKDTETLSTEKLMMLRANLLNNIDIFYSHRKHHGLMSNQSAFINLMKPIASQCDILITQREKLEKPEDITLHTQLSQTYQRIFRNRDNTFNTSLLLNVLHQKDIDLPTRLENANRVIDLLNQREPEYKKDEKDIVKLSVMLCQLKSELQRSTDYKSGKFKEIETWVDNVEKQYIRGDEVNADALKGPSGPSFQRSMHNISALLLKKMKPPPAEQNPLVSPRNSGHQL